MDISKGFWGFFSAQGVVAVVVVRFLHEFLQPQGSAAISHLSMELLISLGRWTCWT